MQQSPAYLTLPLMPMPRTQHTQVHNKIINKILIIGTPRLLHGIENHEVNEVFFIAVCYIPLAGSSRDVDTEERFLMLSEQIQKFGLEGRVIVCGDFNARCGDLEDLSEEMVHLKGSRKSGFHEEQSG